jgi:hypothetical protein
MSDANTIWTTGYTADGFRVSLTLDINADADTVQALLAKLDLVRAAGITPNAPGLEQGQEKEPIGAVMKRQKPSDGTPIIDFYPQWKGAFGKFKYASMYLDTADEIAEFEAQSGLKLNDIPLYDAQQPYQRTADKPHRCEIKVKRSFEIVREKVGEDDRGHPRYKYSYYQPANVTQMPPRSGSDSVFASETGHWGAVAMSTLEENTGDAPVNKSVGTTEAKADRVETVEDVDWSKFWPWTKDLGLTKAEVHEALGVELSAKEFIGSKQQMMDIVQNAANAKQDAA